MWMDAFKKYSNSFCMRHLLLQNQFSYFDSHNVSLIMISYKNMELPLLLIFSESSNIVPYCRENCLILYMLIIWIFVPNYFFYLFMQLLHAQRQWSMARVCLPASGDASSSPYPSSAIRSVRRAVFAPSERSTTRAHTAV